MDIGRFRPGVARCGQHVRCWLARAIDSERAHLARFAGISRSRTFPSRTGRLLLMELRERHIGPIATRSGEGVSEVRVDVGALVRRLLLFEHCTLESDGLVEIPRLVKAFGFRGLMELLESGGLVDHL